MISDLQSRDWMHKLLDQSVKNLPAQNPKWLKKVRQRARQSLEVIEVPNRKQEAWRYSNVEQLLTLSPNVASPATVENDIEPIENWIYKPEQSYRLVFINGRCAPALSNITDLPCNMTIGSLRAMIAVEPELVAKYLGELENKQQNAFSVLNRALINDGLFVYIPSNTQADKPIEIVHLSGQTDNNIASHTRNIIVLGQGAEATIVERYAGVDNPLHFYNGVTELFLEENSQLTHYGINEQNNNSYHLEQRHVSQKENSHYFNTQFSTGSIWAKTDINITLGGSGADCELNGLYMVGDRQLSDIHLNVVHKAAHCNSLENFKGILLGKGRAVFDGRILVEKDAQKSNAHLSNKNLLLTRDAEVDTKPQLEILADDVKCSHGTTVGQLDSNQIFYMRSRGLSVEKAKELLCVSFASEIIEKIAHNEVQTYLENVVRVSILAAVLHGGE